MSVDSPKLEIGEISPVVLEAQERWERANGWEATSRRNWLEDYKFSNADPYNLDQWPNTIRRARDYDDKPTLTINKVRQKNIRITNMLKKNKAGIKVRGTGNGATYESAQILESVIRHIEYKSQADIQYDRGASFMVQAGAGYLRVITDYSDPKTMNQDAFIRNIHDPLTVFMDIDARETDKSDMNYCLLFEDQDIDEFKKMHKNWAKYATNEAIGEGSSWVSSNKIRKCEYYRRVFKDEKLFAITSQDGNEQIITSEMLKDAPEVMKDLEKRAEDEEPGIKVRETKTCTVEYYYIIGNHIVEQKEWIGTTIPIVPMIGEEVIASGVMDRKSHTRALIDPQRMYNFWSSTAVEYGANQTKTPWIAPVEAIEGYEVYWNNANRVNNAVLPYKALSDDGTTPIPAPQRIQPPVPAPVALTGMQVASTEMDVVSGQYADAEGQETNVRTGVALDKRISQGDEAIYHYQDAQNIAIQRIGKILLEIIPKLYDTKRTVRCLARDGTDFNVMIDPQLKQSHMARVNYDTQKIEQVLINPAIGEYDCQIDVGPSFGTRRQEAVQGLTTLMTQSPQSAMIIGDLLVKNMDFDEADEASARLRRMVPPHALGEGPSVTEQQLAKQVQMLEQTLATTIEELAKEKIKVKGKDSLRDIEAFKALTDRINVLAKATIDSKKVQAEGGSAGLDLTEIDELVQQVLHEAMNISLEPVTAAAAPTLSEASLGRNAGKIDLSAATDTPPMRGARQDASGNWFARDFSTSRNFRPVG